MDVDAIQTGEYSVIQRTDTQFDYFRGWADSSKIFALFEAQRFREFPEPMLTHEIGVLSFAGFDEAMTAMIGSTDALERFSAWRAPEER